MGQHMSSTVTYLSNLTNMNHNSKNKTVEDTIAHHHHHHHHHHHNPTNVAVYHTPPKRKRYNTKRIPKDSKLNQNDLQQVTNDVLDLIFDWFPEMHERTYFLPPVHMNKVQYQASSIGSGVQEVKSIQTTPESDWRDDEVMQRTLACLRALTDHHKEAMVVLLQMQHDHYLHKACYAPAAAHYPRPQDLDTHLKRGDFDLLFLHRERGLIVAEIKSVGWRPGGQQDDSTVLRKVRQAVEQLNKARTVLSHLVSDLRPLPRVTPTLILPNVSSQRLRGLLRQDSQLAESLCACLGQDTLDDAISLCLCAQQMTSMNRPADVTPHLLQELGNWWRPLLASGGAAAGCTPEVYELLVARFCGPASTVQVHCVRPPRLEFRTLAHAVQEVGERMVEFVLFPEQLALLQELEGECVYLSGPPGTGKTLMLMLVALQWCRSGRHVHVVSTSTFSEAATHLLYYQVTKTLKEKDPEAASRIHMHLNGNNIHNVRNIVTKLVEASRTAADPAQQQTPTLEGEQPSHTEGNSLSDQEGEQPSHTEGNALSDQEGEQPSHTEGNALSDQEGEQPSHTEGNALSDQDGEQPSHTEGNALSDQEGEQPSGNGEGHHGGQLYLVVDEVGEKFREFYGELKEKVSDLHMWAASYRKEFRPPEMKERVLFSCLRSTPTVMRRMETAISFAAKGVDGYQDRRQEYLSVSDGPAELFLSHEGHSAARAMDCEQCGQAIAHCLKWDLGVDMKQGTAISIKTPSALRYSDVIVIPDYYQDIEDLCDDSSTTTTTSTTTITATATTTSTTTDNNHNHNHKSSLDATAAGQKPTKASGIVQGLRAGGVPAYVVTKQDGASIRELARAAREAVAVVAWGVSNGLERKVVVSVGQGRALGDGRVSGVLHGASRCVSQLVYVKCPENDDEG